MTAVSRLAPAVLLLATAGAGCDLFLDTPEQALAHRRWRECTSERRDVTLQRVETDGRIRFSFVAVNDRDRVLECLEAAGRDGPKLPEPVASLVGGK